jgi:hypothetical protein
VKPPVVRNAIGHAIDSANEIRSAPRRMTAMRMDRRNPRKKALLPKRDVGVSRRGRAGAEFVDRRNALRSGPTNNQIRSTTI